MAVPVALLAKKALSGDFACSPRHVAWCDKPHSAVSQTGQCRCPWPGRAS
jgi:hypothetical protein